MEPSGEAPRPRVPPAERPDIRPLSRRATRILVVAAVLLAIGLAWAGVYLLLETAQRSAVPPGSREAVRAPEVP